MLAHPLECPVCVPMPTKQGHTNSLTHASANANANAHPLTPSRTVQYAVGVSISVDGLGTCVLAYRTVQDPVFYGRMPKNWSVCTARVACRCQTGGGDARVRYRHRPVCAAQVPQCGPQGFPLCLRSVEVYSAWLCSRIRTQTTGKVGWAEGRRKLQLSGMPKLIGHLRNAPTVFPTACLSCVRLFVCVYEGGKEVVRASS